MNFCSAFLGCKISSDKPCIDGFEVTNLIADQKMNFACESFIRPPVKINISFAFPIDIAFIVIQTPCGDRKITGLNIYSTTGKSYSRDKISRGSDIVNNEKQSIDVNKNNEYSEYCIGNWYALKESKILLKNYNYKHHLPLPLPNECNVDNCQSSFIGAIKNFENKSAIYNVCSLKITITNVFPCGSPIVQSIQVWGQPSLTCCPSLKDKVIKLWTAKCSEKLTNSVSIPSMYNSVVKSERLQEPKEEKRTIPLDIAIPDEFLDALTCEVMTLPILLPSGNSIDSHSLEKIIASEAAWGRTPSDPFTGIPFRSDYKPEPNVHLKLRIDRYFLIEKHVDPSSIKERGNTLTNKGPSDALTSLLTLNQDSLSDIPDNKSEEIPTIYSDARSIPNRKRKFQSKDNLQDRKVIQSCSSSSNTTTTTILNSHKLDTRYSVVHSVGSALSSLSKRQSCVQVKRKNSFSSTTEISNSSPPTTSRSQTLSTPTECPEDKYSLAGMSGNLQCSSCENLIGIFYSLKCGHQICNKCLKSKNSDSERKNSYCCTKCGHISLSQHLKRIHPKSAFTI